MKKTVTIVSPCYNEELNVRELAAQVHAQMAHLASRYDYKILFIDNCSTDGTEGILRELASQDPRIQVIFNLRNFGHIRSPFHALLQTDADATILMASDLQDPPSLLPKFLELWEQGNPVVMAVKNQSEESPLMYAVRSLYYRFINRLSDIELVKNTTGFGLYNRKCIELLRTIDDPYPYFRGLVSELGFKPVTVNFFQPTRKRGITKNNFYTLYDIAMLGITNHSKVPLRVATLSGFALSALSLLVALGYLVAKLIFWSRFELGMAPVLIGLFLFCSVQLFFIGILGEYMGSIFTQVLKRPRVVERERIGF